MVSGAGLTLALVGEALRKAAILTARGNFTHLVCVPCVSNGCTTQSSCLCQGLMEPIGASLRHSCSPRVQRCTGHVSSAAQARQKHTPRQLHCAVPQKQRRQPLAMQCVQMQVRFERHDRHVLVRHGVYAWVRHPGYLGFLLWAAGTQLLLANPACLVLFVAAVSRWNLSGWQGQFLAGSFCRRHSKE